MSRPTRRGGLLDRTVQQRDARIFVIAVEGARDEAEYFERLRLNGTIPRQRVKVEILPTTTADGSSPRQVLDRLVDFREQHVLGALDECWLVMDVDRHERLAEVAREAKQREYRLAVSNPCFEVWLLLHFDSADLSGPCKELKPRKGRLVAEIPPAERWPTAAVTEAVERARKLDTRDGWMPDAPGTKVYALIESLLSA